MEYLRINVSSTGQLTLPEHLLRSLNIDEGGVLLVREETGALVVDSVESRVAKARAIVQKYIPPGTLMVDDFIAERRAEAERE